MRRQTEVTLYGGPGHRKVVHWEQDCQRIVMAAPRPMPPPYLPKHPDDPFPFGDVPNAVRTSYHLQLWEMAGRTQLGRVRVRRSLWVGLWEDAPLLPHERYEVDDALEDVPWEWDREPPFLKNFEAWYEKTLHDLGWKRIRVCY